ncbi:hypothetical protein MKW98_031163 [Papaver atlanticum]|uniref:ABC transporter domain-containing protein n=1 Tax=Papaver atlanticum TaxID=357466 RepID=A0AAD4SWU8_9MAGN|nr:hypothetical protein MKW98_031163 [Papaver atlanticum]
MANVGAALTGGGDDLSREMSRSSIGGDRRSWTEQQDGGGFHSIIINNHEEDEEELKWAAIERLPTYDRVRKSVFIIMDVAKLGAHDKKQLMSGILKVVEEDNEKFLRRLRNRVDRVGIDIPKIEVRFENLSVEGDAFVASRTIFGFIRCAPSKKRVNKILHQLNGVLKPSRLTLLLGPPASGKTTFLQALAGKLDKSLRVTGKVTYCGHEFSEFIPQRTSEYIIRETLDFSGRCFGVGPRFDMLAELSRREKEAGIKPDPEIDAFMKVTAVEGQESSLVTDYVLKILGPDICADTMVDGAMARGISGGQKKRVTTGEMLVGTAKALFMDEISTGLDSSTTFQIIKFMKQMVHEVDATMIISLLQPAPETFELFDDIVLLSGGEVIYQGPRENVLEFFESMGFRCPERKGVADFLQEVISKKDQEQYWYNTSEPYRYISVYEFVNSFKSYHLGQQLKEELGIPYDKSRTHPAALVKTKYGISNRELFKACFSREWLLMKRRSFLYIFKTCQITFMSIITLTMFLRTEMTPGTISGGGKYLGSLFFSPIQVMFNGMAELAMTVFGLPVFYKQRDFLFYPAWAYALPIWVLRIPLSFMESAIWIILTYYSIGFAPAASRFFRQFLTFFSIHQMALSLFRFIAALGRTTVVANILGSFTLLLVFVLGGYVISKDDLQPWMSWIYYVSPMMYGQNAIAINEFLDERWDKPLPRVDPVTGQSTVGKALLKSRGMFLTDNWFWICVGALFAFSVLFNILFMLALTYLSPFGDSKALIEDEDDSEKLKNIQLQEISGSNAAEPKRGMVLPFQPLSLSFNHVNYYVDMPAEMKSQGIEETRLQLLRDVSGAFRPGVLTALMGVSGAGKTTLMDVLAGRKTGGYIEGETNISGYPKNQATFARVSGYCEQNDIHSPYVTVYESLMYSAWLRLSADVKKEARIMFVDEVMDLVELHPLRNSLVGKPGEDGLSTEQRKRLTIAVELVANPSIIFMDEPTSGLDARAAAIVMRAVRNTVDTGRTVVCTIHQPRGQVTYAGPLGARSHNLVEYFQSVPGVPKIRDGYNPAAWMLDVSSASVEAQLDVDFAEVYANSTLYQRNQELIKELSTPAPGSKDLHFPTEYSQDFITQCKACFWKQHWSYWRNPKYNAVRLFTTTVIGILFGVIFRDKGDKASKQQDLKKLLGAMYSSTLFLGAGNATSVQPVVAVERTVFYREKAAGMYSALPYAFAQVKSLAIEVIYVFVQTLVYSLILFSMIGFPWGVAKFLYFIYFMFMCFIYFTMYGMMCVVLTPSPQTATITMSFFTSLWNLFSGFLLPRPQIPIWWRWYYWGSPVAWTIYGLVASQVGDKTNELLVPGLLVNPTVKSFLKDHFAHIGFVLAFFFVFAYGIKNLNFQRR